MWEPCRAESSHTEHLSFRWTNIILHVDGKETSLCVSQAHLLNPVREVLVKLPGTESFPFMVSFHWRLVVNRNTTFWYNFLLSGFFPKFNYFKKFSILWDSKDHNYIFTNDDNLGLSFPVIIPFTSALFPTSLTRTILNIMLLIGIFFLSRVVCLFQLYTLSF